MASKEPSMGVLLELRGMGCRHLENVLQARKIGWYDFLNLCTAYKGIVKRFDLAVNDMGGLLDIAVLRERYYENKVYKRSKKFEAVNSGSLIGNDKDTARTFYIGSQNSSLYFCLYEKEKEQKKKGIQTDIKNRFEIRLKNQKAKETVERFLLTGSLREVVTTLIETQIYFTDYILWDIFLENIQTSLPLITVPVAVNMDKTLRWIKRQVMPSIVMIKEIEKKTDTHYLKDIREHTQLTEKQELKIKQMITKIDDIIET